MDILQISLALGVASLYFAFAGGFGFLLRRAKGATRFAVLSVAYVVALLMPATAFVLGLEAWPSASKAVVVVLAALTAVVTYWQPDWIPGQIWRRAWGYVYLSLAMAFSALWGITFGLAASANPAFILGVISLAAGSTALKNTYPSLSKT